MLLWRKSGRSKTGITTNETLKEKPIVIQECDLPCTSSLLCRDKQHATPSGRSNSWAPTPEERQRPSDGAGERTRGSSQSLAQTRKTSRECVVPHDIVITSEKKAEEEENGPVLKVSFADGVGTAAKSRPITLQRIRSEESECISIRDLSESPQRFGACRAHKEEDMSLLSAGSSHDSDMDRLTFQPPSSPLLVAMRTAVESLNQYDDFEILEEIGAGFFAVVYKVSPINYIISCH